MSLFSFIKTAGAVIFGGKGEKKRAAEVAADEVRREEAAAARLEETIHDLQLEVENLNIVIDSDKATVSGEAHDQSTREKIVLVIGNSEGIASVEDLMSVKHTEPEAKFHTVVSGDSLSKIAKEYYGDAMKYPVIFEANKPMLSDPDKIYPGQVLRIPHLDN